MDIPSGIWITSAIIGVVGIPLILRKVPPNPVYGFRTSLTLSKPGIWYPVNAFAGWALLVAAATSLIVAWIAPAQLMAAAWFVVATVVVPLVIALAACFLRLRRYGRQSAE